MNENQIITLLIAYPIGLGFTILATWITSKLFTVWFDYWYDTSDKIMLFATALVFSPISWLVVVFLFCSPWINFN